MLHDAPVLAYAPSILLVDDDPDALTASSALLDLLGYRVTAVDDPLRALELLQDGQPFDVMLTDVVMPAMSGIRLAEEAVRLRQDLHVVYVTGYAGELITGAGQLRGKVVLKPWSIEELEDAIRRG